MVSLAPRDQPWQRLPSASRASGPSRSRLGANGTTGDTRKMTLRPLAGSKLDRRYGQYIFGAGVFSIVMLIALSAVVTLMFMNFVFVFPPDFGHSDVPYYETPIDDAPFRQATRYGVNYILITLTTLRYGSIFFSYCALVASSRGSGSGWATAAAVWNGLIALYDLGVSIYWLILAYTPAKCAATNLCRAWTASPGDPVNTAGDPNWVFLMLAWNGIGFLFMHGVYLWLMWTVRTNIVRRQAAIQRANPDPGFEL